MTMLQGHRGVSTEYPENTMTSYRAAIEQGYDYIELDPAVTADGVPVLLHDATVGRTGRNFDGSVIEGNPRITDITYAEALKYDFGIAFHKKFKGERIPRLSDVLDLVKNTAVKIKIDNKIWGFDKESTDTVLKMLKAAPEHVAVTCNALWQIEKALCAVPDIEIHYDGAVNEETLKEISALVPRDKLTVWLPIECKLTSWVKVPFVSHELCALIKKYGRLGIWLISEYADYDRAVNEFSADLIETNGQIKPVKNKGLLADMHSHTKSSHDAESDINELCEKAIENGINLLAITDHFDGVLIDKIDPYKVATSSVNASSAAKERFKDKLTVLTGIEFGEAFWAPKEYKKVSECFDFDVRIGSVHAVRYKDRREPFSVIDFSVWSKDEISAYFSQYLDDMTENLAEIDFDILAHLDNPIKYIKGKFGIELDMTEYAEKIDEILTFIIKHGIALEINTATFDMYGDNMPSESIVKRYVELGGYLITLGADSHFPERVGKYLTNACELVKALGLRNVFYYKGRRSYQISI